MTDTLSRRTLLQALGGVPVLLAAGSLGSGKRGCGR